MPDRSQCYPTDGPRVVTFGTFDLLHIGHLNVLHRARAMGSRLIVGVSSDDLNWSKKRKRPAYPLIHRLALVRALRCVDEVFVEESLELKRQYLIDHRAELLVMGDDWAGRFDHLADVCAVQYLPRTQGISSTEVKAYLQATRHPEDVPGVIDGAPAAHPGFHGIVAPPGERR